MAGSLNTLLHSFSNTTSLDPSVDNSLGKYFSVGFDVSTIQSEGFLNNINTVLCTNYGVFCSPTAFDINDNLVLKSIRVFSPKIPGLRNILPIGFTIDMYFRREDGSEIGTFAIIASDSITKWDEKRNLNLFLNTGEIGKKRAQNLDELDNYSAFQLSVKLNNGTNPANIINYDDLNICSDFINRDFEVMIEANFIHVNPIKNTFKP